MTKHDIVETDDYIAEWAPGIDEATKAYVMDLVLSSRAIVEARRGDAFRRQHTEIVRQSNGDIMMFM